MEAVFVLGWIMLVIVAIIMPRTVLSIFACYVAVKFGVFNYGSGVVGALLVSSVPVSILIDGFAIWEFSQNPNRL